MTDPLPEDLDPRSARGMARQGTLRGPTAGLCPGRVQANLVVLPREHAFHFLLFCQRNPRPCPLLEVIEDGGTEPAHLAPGADVRTDLPRYRVFRGDRVEERDEVTDLWRPDLVTFLIGCSFTFESGLLRAGVPVRHVELGRNVPMFVTDRRCAPAGPFSGPLVVSMRPIPAPLVSAAVTVTARFPGVHGAPIHVGDPAGLGIRDLQRPEFGDPVPIRGGEIPVFWACGVTPQLAIREARPEFALTHAPGHMLVTDRLDEEFAVA